MNEMQKIVVVSPITKKRLDEMKLEEGQKGLRTTLGGIVDKLVENEYENRKKADVV